jgi:hypothetical protein
LSRVETPLLSSVVISPIALFGRKNLWKNYSFKRSEAFKVCCVLQFDCVLGTFDKLNKALICFCRDKPEVIQRIEHEIWSCICEVAKGTVSTVDALQETLQKIEGIMESFSDRLEADWFWSQ